MATNNPTVTPDEISTLLTDVEKHLAILSASSATLPPLLSTLKTSLEGAQVAARGHLNNLANAAQAAATIAQEAATKLKTEAAQ